MCTRTDTFEAPSLQFQRWQKITILSSPFQGYFWLGLFSDGKRFQPPPNSTLPLFKRETGACEPLIPWEARRQDCQVGGERGCGCRRGPPILLKLSPPRRCFLKEGVRERRDHPGKAQVRPARRGPRVSEGSWHWEGTFGTPRKGVQQKEEASGTSSSPAREEVGREQTFLEGRGQTLPGQLGAARRGRSG